MIYIILLIVIIAGVYYYKKPKAVGAVHSNWCQHFDRLQFSTQEFYTLVEEILSKYEMPDAKISRVFYNEGSAFSNKREYLRVECKENIFDICAAPYGTGFFVSYWLGEPKHGMRDLATRVPHLSTAVEGWQGSTYYQVDTSNVFKWCVKDSITQAIQQITGSKGVRGLSDLEKLMS